MRTVILFFMGVLLGIAAGTYLGVHLSHPSRPPHAWGVDTIVWRTDTVRLTDTVRIPPPASPPQTRRASPDRIDSVRIDERRDHRLWLRIADTLRAGRLAGRAVDYQWIAPIPTQRVHLRLAPTEHPLAPWAPRRAQPKRPATMLQIGYDTPGQPWIGGAIRYRNLWIGARAGYDPRAGQPSAGAWVGYQF